jgi:hypothetical protein
MLARRACPDGILLPAYDQPFHDGTATCAPSQSLRAPDTRTPAIIGFAILFGAMGIYLMSLLVHLVAAAVAPSYRSNPKKWRCTTFKPVPHLSLWRNSLALHLYPYDFLFARHNMLANGIVLCFYFIYLYIFNSDSDLVLWFEHSDVTEWRYFFIRNIFNDNLEMLKNHFAPWRQPRMSDWRVNFPVASLSANAVSWHYWVSILHGPSLRAVAPDINLEQVWIVESQYSLLVVEHDIPSGLLRQPPSTRDLIMDTVQAVEMVASTNQRLSSGSLPL